MLGKYGDPFYAGGNICQVVSAVAYNACRYCSLDNMEISHSIGYESEFGITLPENRDDRTKMGTPIRNNNHEDAAAGEEYNSLVSYYAPSSG